MTYGEVKRSALKLCNQYSVAGGEILPTYNNQQDYLDRIPQLVNDAMVYIATNAKPIPAMVSLSELTSLPYGKVVGYKMPSDFLSFRTAYAQSWEETGAVSYPFVGVRNDDIVLLSAKAPGDCVIEYNRYPRLLNEEPVESAELDGTVDTQMIIPYYVAAHLALGEDAYMQATLYNEFETRLSRLNNPRTYATVEAEDAYGFFGTVYEA